jgi:hypothetical protein
MYKRISFRQILDIGPVSWEFGGTRFFYASEEAFRRRVIRLQCKSLFNLFESKMRMRWRVKSNVPILLQSGIPVF